MGDNLPLQCFQLWLHTLQHLHPAFSYQDWPDSTSGRLLVSCLAAAFQISIHKAACSGMRSCMRSCTLQKEELLSHEQALAHLRCIASFRGQGLMHPKKCWGAGSSFWPAASSAPWIKWWTLLHVLAAEGTTGRVLPFMLPFKFMLLLPGTDHASASCVIGHVPAPWHKSCQCIQRFLCHRSYAPAHPGTGIQDIMVWGHHVL
eukprot:1160258-Pelagomonas_calceolata.AAC.9